MAHKAEMTFGNLQMDERFKKLERSLKLALLKGGKPSPFPTWPSISSINADTLDSSYVTPSLQVSQIGSEVLASSNNLRKMSAKNRNHNINQEGVAVSSVKEYNVKQDNHIDRCVMPPPTIDRVYRTSKTQNRVHTLADCKKPTLTSLNSSIQSSAVTNFFSDNAPTCVSVNTNSDKEYQHSLVASVTSINDIQKVDRVFSKWRVMLNGDHQLIIKGTLECGKVARSKPVIRRYTATCVESINKHKYNLQGNIVDERNELPDYIHGKFYNGFPDDWENVYQIWRTFVNQGCLVTFRWPTPITDSDDDLKSELTDLTYTCGTRNKANVTKSHNSAELAGQLIKSKSPSIESPEKTEKCLNYTRNLQNYGNNRSLVKTFTSDTEKDVIPIAQTENVNNEDNKPNVETNMTPLCNPRRTNRSDIFQEDKLNVIINNLADRNCTPKYVDKIIEMLDCLQYLMSYRSESEYNSETVLSTSRETFKSTSVPLQPIPVYDKGNCTNGNKLESTTERKSYVLSSDLGYASIRNDSNPIQLSNVRDSVEPERENVHENSDKSESEIYAGIPKISIDRVIRSKEALGKTFKRKARKKAIQSNAVREFDVRATDPMSNVKKNLLADESAVSITEDEVEVLSTKRWHKANVIQRPQEMALYNHRKLHNNNNFDACGENGTVPVTRMQNEQASTSETRKFRLSAFIKEGNVSYKENAAHPRFTDVDYTTNSEGEKDDAITTNAQKTCGTVETALHTNLYQEIMTISSESNSNKVLNKTREVHKEFIEQPRSEATIKRAKPTVISSVPVNLNLKVTNINPQKSVQSHDSNVSIVESEGERCASIRPMEEAHKKNPSRAPTGTKRAIITYDSHTKTTNDSKKESYAISNTQTRNNNAVRDNKNVSNYANPASSVKSTTNPSGRSKNSKLGENSTKVLTAWTPKVVYYFKSKTELGLTFQGKLLNEAGHVMHRKFTTDIVLKRLSPTLIETVNHEFYQLLGCLNDNKHDVPKELVKQCRNGCPAKIEHFCLTWESLQDGKVENIREKSHDASMDSLSVPVSSRGRKILPPLNYWTGERITLKDNIPIYSPGTLQESLVSFNKSSYRALTNTEGRKKRRMDFKSASKSSVNKETPLLKTNEASSASKNKRIVIEKDQSFRSPKAANSVRKESDTRKPRRAAIDGKRRIAQQLTFSSTDSSEEERELSPRKRVRTSQPNANVDAEAPLACIMKLRKR